jgi:hypothetical protein
LSNSSRQLNKCEITFSLKLKVIINLPKYIDVAAVGIVLGKFQEFNVSPTLIVLKKWWVAVGHTRHSLQTYSYYMSHSKSNPFYDKIMQLCNILPTIETLLLFN